MAWDSKRPVPWRRLGIYLALYALVMVGFAALTQQTDVSALLRSLLIGVPIAGLAVVVLAKFGYLLPILKGRDVLAAERAERIAQRRAAKGIVDQPVASAVAGPRPKPPPTRRTTTGPSQRKSSNRKR